MKVVLVALALVAVASAASIEGQPLPAIVRSEYEQEADGRYKYSYETSDGIAREESGDIKVVPNEKNEPQSVVVVRGSFTYTDSEGNVESVQYEADENGFRAVGPSIPKVAGAQ